MLQRVVQRSEVLLSSPFDCVPRRPLRQNEVMPKVSKPIEVFQDLHLRGPASALGALHRSLKEQAVSPWRFAIEKVDQLRAMGEEGDALAFERAQTPGFEAAGLVLLPASDGMEVVNIIPLSVDELSYGAYNAILQDFASQVAVPAAKAAGYRVDLSGDTLQLEDELPPKVLEALRKFSVTANRSTGASHPRDQERWFDFIIQAHRSGAKLDASTLARWLSESEGWPENGARDLAAEYERSRELLVRFSESE